VSIYYAEMLDVLAAAGCYVAESATTDGWQTRARSSGGFPEPPLGVWWHHTASSTSAVEGPWKPASITSSGTWSVVDIAAECIARAEPLPPPQQEDDMLRKVLVPRLGPTDPPWWPWLATFDSGVVRPLASNEPEPLSGKADIDVSQYRTLCAWAGINLEVQP
jgi:hypothetical protein